MAQTTFYDRYVRLEPYSRVRDLDRGFEASVYDPCWFLARQWQMGEHQGENASSPVAAHYRLSLEDIRTLPGEPKVNLTEVPAEAVVESELDDWWTMGRRIRVGRQVKALLGDADAHPELRFNRPPPPYDAFHGKIDGLAAWRQRAAVPELNDFDWGETSPPDSPLAWKSAHLHYERSFDASSSVLEVKRHHGGPMDWYSVDAKEPGNGGEPAQIVEGTVIPSPLVYPGAPNPRWWQIEEAKTDIGGYPPDPSSFATMLLVDLIYSHADDWFLFPVTVRAGNVSTIKEVVIKDCFGRSYKSTDPAYPGLLPPSDWGMFNCAGMDEASLVLWNIAECPLESEPIERVQFGIDEQTNYLWGVERIVDGREVESKERILIDDAANPLILDPASKPNSAVHKAKSFQYIPGVGAQLYWHPYDLVTEDNKRVFVQRGLADLSRHQPLPLPHPAAETLYAGTPNARLLHRVDPSAIPSNGIEIERRWMLARDLLGNPVSWTQRQRKPLVSPPVHLLRFDVMEEIELKV